MTRKSHTNVLLIGRLAFIFWIVSLLAGVVTFGCRFTDLLRVMTKIDLTKEHINWIHHDIDSTDAEISRREKQTEMIAVEIARLIKERNNLGIEMVVVMERMEKLKEHKAEVSQKKQEIKAIADKIWEHYYPRMQELGMQPNIADD